MPVVHEPVLMWTGSQNSYCVTGLFYVTYEVYRGEIGSQFVKDSRVVNNRDVFFFSINTTGGDWNLPFRFNTSDDDWNLVELQSYEIPKRVSALDLSLFNVSMPENSSVCDFYSQLIKYDRTVDLAYRVRCRGYTGAWDSWVYTYSRENNPIFNTNLWLGWPDQFSNFSSYDYDAGGETDISEWANFHDRFNPDDDLTSCGENRDPETDEEKTNGGSLRVDWGNETKTLYLSGLTGLVGDSVSPPTLEGAAFPTTQRATIPDRLTLFNEIKARSDSALASGQYAALREVFAPLASDVRLPVWSLPSSTVEVGGVSTTFDLRFLSIDLNSLIEDETWSRIFRFMYLLIELGLVLITAWYVKNLLWSSLIGLPED